ncbi:MAG: hypothetical protein IPH80_10255 [Myxococcales bacterium]|nr:hypothetical protein [Myxococcales bacterium]
MAPKASTTSSRRLASTIALATTALVAGNAAMRDQQADACGWGGPVIEDLTTFDPAVANEPGGGGLHYDPYVDGFGGPCDDCARTAMAADWAAYFGTAIAGADWDKVLYGATARDLAALRAAVASGGKAPRGYEALANAVAGRTSMREQALRALDYVALARATEAFASFDGTAPSAAEVKRLKALATSGEKAAAKAGDAFLAQRFGFQQVRLAFYARDWQGAIAAFDARAAALAKPSADLAGRARYYAAGALRQQGDLARANLELARVHGTTPALAGVAAQDFQPMEDRDWKATLAMAKDARERTELWRLVGFKLDGIGAAQEIVKLDPTSNLIGLLAVRELSRIESTSSAVMGPPDPTTVAARQKAAANLEQLVTTLAATPGADRPWLLQLVGGHLAARRGDLKAARARLAAAQQLRPNDAKVTGQARATLALALAQSGPLGGALGDELGRTMTAVGPDFGRMSALTLEVRGRLADAALKAGRPVDAEFLRPDGAATAAKWSDAKFLKQMIARANRNATAFDRFVTGGSYSRAALEQELALRNLLDGKFADAAKAFATKRAASSALGTDPFVTHIVDCHDCDHATYGSAPWTHATMVARMATLVKQANGKGQPAADAALELGNAFYNMTWYGNARVVLDGTHQTTRDTAQAARWYKRAYEQGKRREFKAQAAFYAAKAELQALITKQYQPYEEAAVLPVPTTWYPVVKTFADTQYYQEVLRECGAYAAWARQ